MEWFLDLNKSVDRYLDDPNFVSEYDTIFLAEVPTCEMI